MTTEELDSLFYWQEIMTKIQDPMSLLQAFEEDEKKQIMRRFENEILVQELQKKKMQDTSSVSSTFSSLFFKAIQGDVDAQYNIGQHYYELKNYTEAIKWFKLAANQGCLLSESMIGRYYYQHREDDLAMESFIKLAQHGYPKAMNLIGQIYESKNNHVVALEWFHKALASINISVKEQGIAQYNIAVVYNHKKENDQAIYYMELASKSGNTNAQDFIKNYNMYR